MGVRGNTTRINFERGVTGTMGERACAREGEDKGRSDPHGRGVRAGTTPGRTPAPRTPVAASDWKRAWGERE